MDDINRLSPLDAQDIERFNDHINAATQRVKTLWGSSEAGPQSTSGLYSKAVEELQTTLEELQIAYEELQVQQDALIDKHEQLLRDRQRYQDLFEFSPEGALVTDRDGLILAVNQAMAQLLGVPQQWLLGKPLITFVPLELRGDFRQMITQAQQSPSTNRCNAILQRRDQVMLPVRITIRLCQPPYDHELWWAVQDRRDRHAAEMAMQLAQNQLEQKVQERTAALVETNQRLQAEIVARQQAEQTLQFQARQEHLLQSIANRIRSSLDLNQMLTATVDEVQQLLDVDRVLILQFQSDGRKQVATEARTAYCHSLQGQTYHEPCFESSPKMQHYCQGGVLAIADVFAADLNPCLLETLSSMAVRALLIVPILQQSGPENQPPNQPPENQVWGALVAHHCRSPRPWHDHEQTLLLRLATQVSIAIQQSALYVETRRLAMVDGLTQVANRRQFDLYLTKMWKQHLREQTPLALMLSDIDFFKHYNDTYGHPAGDRCLQSIANTLKHRVKRPHDLLARYGGEEFIAILPKTDLIGAQHLAETCRAHIQSLKLPHSGSPQQQITLSFGVASLVPTPDQPVETLIEMADQALYEAKARGRNQVVTWPIDPH